MDLMLLSWSWIGAAGAAGACLNALMSGPIDLLPSVIRVSTDHRIPRPGLFVAAVIGGAASVGCTAAYAGLTCQPAFSADGAVAVALLASSACGFIAARCVTQESDRRVLRAAVCKASSAPAAHPDTVRAFESAPVSALYHAVEQLMPRAAVHP